MAVLRTASRHKGLESRVGCAGGGGRIGAGFRWRWSRGAGDSAIGHALRNAKTSGAADIKRSASVGGILAGVTIPPVPDPAPGAAGPASETLSGAPPIRSRLDPGC